MSFYGSPRTIFDTAVSLCDQARPGVPEVLIDDILSLSGIPPVGRYLEIRRGPGKATAHLPIEAITQGWGRLRRC